LRNVEFLEYRPLDINSGSSYTTYRHLELPLASATALLELRNLVCERDERILFAGLNAQFYAGQVVQILGPNGSGKTTLLRILAGVSRDYQGDIHWQGKPIAQMTWEFANELLYLGHLPGVKKSLTALENLRWYAALQGAVMDEQLIAALAQVNLAGYEDTPLLPAFCRSASPSGSRPVGF
jgi:heme exporter protein A